MININCLFSLYLYKYINFRSTLVIFFFFKLFICLVYAHIFSFYSRTYRFLSIDLWLCARIQQKRKVKRRRFANYFQNRTKIEIDRLLLIYVVLLFWCCAVYPTKETHQFFKLLIIVHNVCIQSEYLSVWLKRNVVS